MDLNIFYVFIILGFRITTVLSNTFHRNLVAHTFQRYPNKNMVISTLSLQFSLCKLATIAEGKAKEEIMKSLEFSNDKELTRCYPKASEIIEKLMELDMNLFNKIYIDYGKVLDEKFISDSRKKFGVDVEKIGFSYPKTAKDFINREVAQATLRRVTDIVEDSDISNQTCIMLLTGAHLRPTWEARFNAQKSKSRSFYGAAGLSNVIMMSQDGDALYYDSRHYKIITTKLMTWGTSLTFVMPTAIRGITGFLNELAINPDLMKDIRKSMQWRQITLTVPKFKINTHLDLTDVFNKTGVSEILMKNTTSLKNLLKDRSSKEKMFVSKIKQKIIMNVDEFGVIRNNYQSPQSQMHDPSLKSFSRTMFDVVLDRPFYFAINLEESLVAGGGLDAPYHELFSGVYYGPEIN